MAAEFDGPLACADGQFTVIHFRETVPDNHPVRFIDKFIDSIEVSTFEEKYKVGAGKKGRAPKDVRLMLKVILYAIYCRIYSARKIDYATEHYADFWFFTHQKRISHDKISDFITMHGDDLHTVFIETISLAHANALLSFDALYQDGFKIKANASKQKNCTLSALDKKEEKLSANLTKVIEQLQDANDECALSKEKKKIQGKLSQIGTLRDELIQRISQRSERKAASQRKKLEKKLTINPTDPDAELMKQKDNSHTNSYLKITGTDNKANIVIASTVTGHDHEACNSLPLFNQANSNLKEIDSSKTYDKAIGDSGFTQIATCEEYEKNGVQMIGPSKEHEVKVRNKEADNTCITFEYDEQSDTVLCSEGCVLNKIGTHYNKVRDAYINIYSNKEACQNCSRLNDCTKSKKGYRTVKIDPRVASQKRTLEKYLSDEGQALYKKRSHVAETYQGDLKKNGRFTHYYLRGLNKVSIESKIHDIVWNIRRIFSETIQSGIAWTT
jgi:transposase